MVEKTQNNIILWHMKIWNSVFNESFIGTQPRPFGYVFVCGCFYARATEVSSTPGLTVDPVTLPENIPLFLAHYFIHLSLFQNLTQYLLFVWPFIHSAVFVPSLSFHRPVSFLKGISLPALHSRVLLPSPSLILEGILCTESTNRKRLRRNGSDKFCDFPSQ